MNDINSIKSILDYCPHTGLFTWKESRRVVKKGDIAGCEFKNSNGRIYISIRVNRKLFLAHRLAFLYMENEIPNSNIDIDHINGNGIDNRWINLRKVTRTGNMQNAKINSRNKSGICGVSLIKNTNKWYAYIRADGKSINLGVYENKHDAIMARKNAETKYGFHINHGNKRLQYDPHGAWNK